MDIHKFRKEHARIARIRDDDTCQYCKHILGLSDVPASDVHHVHGRAASPSMRETHEFLLCMCRRHHRDFHDNLESYIVEKVIRALDAAKSDPAQWGYLEKHGREVIARGEAMKFRQIASLIDLHKCEILDCYESLVKVDGYLFCGYCLEWFVITGEENDIPFE